ncbi:MAG: hypothetical protein SGBAC_012440 [Bacillariaceae sp.]
MNAQDYGQLFMRYINELAVCSISLSVAIMVYFQTSDTYEENWIHACNEPTNRNMEQWVQDHPGLVSYAEQLEFGAFQGQVCRQTQLYYHLNEYNASAIGGILAATVSMPLLMAMLLEAGRGDAGAPLKIPLIIWVLSQEFGLAVVFPLLWLPLYCFFKGENKSAIHPFRVYASLPLVLPQLVLTILIFWLEPGSPGWANCVGLLAGPVFAGCSMLLNLFGDISTEETEETKRIAATSRRLMALMYGAAGLLSVAAWLFLLFVMIIPTYGLSSIQFICDALWTNAPTKLRYRTIPQAVIEALSISAVFGPGAGLCLSLAGAAVSQDLEAVSEAGRSEQNKDDDKDKKE